MPDVKQLLFNHAKRYNALLETYIENDELSTNYAARAIAVEDIICELGLWDEYLQTYGKDGK